MSTTPPRRRTTPSPAIRLAPLALLGCAACGGVVVFEEDGGAGGGASGVTTTASGTSVSSTAGGTSASSTSGPAGCTRHEDCGDALCVFATGACAPACDSGACDACGPGAFCEECATSSCPECRDCLAACVPADERCDDDDPCPAGSICHFGEGRCSAGCTADGACEDPSDVCAPCEASSCCGCKDCVGGCIVPEE